MFDRRLIRELKRIKGFWIKVAVAAIAVVTLTIFQGQKLAWIIDGIIIKKVGITNILGVVAFLAFIILAKNISAFLYEYYHRLCAIKIKEHLRDRLVKDILLMGPVKLRDKSSGALSSVVQTGIDQLEPYFSEFIPQLVMVMASTVLVLASVMWVDWISGVIMLVTVPFIPVFMILIGKMATNVNQQQWKKLQQMNGHFLDVLRGLPTLRLFGRLKRQAEIVKEVNEAFRGTTMKVLRIAFLSALVLELVATISTALVAVSLGIRLIYGRMDFYNAFFVLLMVPEYYQPIRQLGAKFHAAIGSRAAADEVYQYLNNRDEARHKEGSSGNVMTNEEMPSQVEVAIQNLCYTYDNGHQVLNDVTIHIPWGKKIALVGPSGGGKSTLTAILLGFVHGHTGNIRINNHLRDDFSTDAWRRYFAYVPQNPKLFKGSLLDNLIMANPEAAMDDVEEVVEKVGMKNWVTGLPEGYNTYIGEGGIALSGGQAQLVVIARALLKKAPILIMDEPTSALDSETEARINHVLNEAFKGKSVFIIAHRMPTIMNSDRIYYLENGKIIEVGNHEELTRLGGHYYKNMNSGEVAYESI